MNAQVLRRLGGLLLMLCLSGTGSVAGDADGATPGPFDYARAASWPRCDTAPVGREPTAPGVGVRLRRPTNHEPRVRHPLLVVFSPARTSGAAAERRIGLTRELTSAGFLVAYVDAVPLGPSAARALAEVPRAISRDWCIDASRLYLMGHSDGGSFAHMLAVMPEWRDRVRGLVASAAGVDRPDLEAYGCPAPVRTLVLHSTRDRLFPGFGERSAAWWARCNRCTSDGPHARADGCREWSGCAAATVFCAGDGPHASWPERGSTIVQFLDERSRP